MTESLRFLKFARSECVRAVAAPAIASVVSASPTVTLARRPCLRRWSITAGDCAQTWRDGHDNSALITTGAVHIERTRRRRRFRRGNSWPCHHIGCVKTPPAPNAARLLQRPVRRSGHQKRMSVGRDLARPRPSPRAGGRIARWPLFRVSGWFTVSTGGSFTSRTLIVIGPVAEAPCGSATNTVRV